MSHRQRRITRLAAWCADLSATADFRLMQPLCHTDGVCGVKDRTFLWKTGFVCPPKPDCLLSYRRLPADGAGVLRQVPSSTEAAT